MTFPNFFHSNRPFYGWNVIKLWLCACINNSHCVMCDFWATMVTPLWFSKHVPYLIIVCINSHIWINRMDNLFSVRHILMSAKMNFNRYVHRHCSGECITAFAQIESNCSPTGMGWIISNAISIFAFKFRISYFSRFTGLFFNPFYTYLGLCGIDQQFALRLIVHFWFSLRHSTFNIVRFVC